MEDKLIVEVIEFTDPVCTWCWGSEPVLRKLETHYGDQLRIGYVMGGLVKDIRDFYDSFNDIGGDAEHSNAQIAKHWLEASERHGMPVKSEGFRLFSNEYPSTYPQNIAYKAAQKEDQNLADRFLRQMRVASATEARQTNQTEVQIELAAEVGLDIAAFIERINDGSAKAAFEDDLRLTAQFGVRGFPTFLINYGGKSVMLRGYQRFEAFKAVIKSLAGDAVKEQAVEKTEENIIGFIEKHVRVAPIEIQAAFDLSNEELQSLLENLQEKRSVRLTPAGNGFIIELIANPFVCDPNTGVCAS
ncbi:MAG: DsbA family protein [Anaerolineaceae bacterium]